MDETRTLSVDPNDLKKVHEALRKMTEEQILPLKTLHPFRQYMRGLMKRRRLNLDLIPNLISINLMGIIKRKIKPRAKTPTQNTQQSMTSTQSPEETNQETSPSTQEFNVPKYSSSHRSLRSSNMLTLLVGVVVEFFNRSCDYEVALEKKFNFLSKKGCILNHNLFSL